MRTLKRSFSSKTEQRNNTSHPPSSSPFSLFAIIDRLVPHLYSIRSWSPGHIPAPSIQTDPFHHLRCSLDNRSHRGPVGVSSFHRSSKHTSRWQDGTSCQPLEGRCQLPLGRRVLFPSCRSGSPSSWGSPCSEPSLLHPRSCCPCVYNPSLTAVTTNQSKRRINDDVRGHIYS